MLNHVNLGYNSINLGAGFNSPNANAANIPGLLAPFFPILNFFGPDNISSFGQQQNGQNIDNGIRVSDSVSWQKGRNSFKFGVDVRYQRYSTIAPSSRTRREEHSLIRSSWIADSKTATDPR